MFVGITSGHTRYPAGVLQWLPLLLRRSQRKGLLLYYFGVLTLTGRGELGELAFGVPNLVIRSLYVEELRKRLLPDVQDTDRVTHLARH